jgi:hypothetical protein
MRKIQKGGEEKRKEKKNTSQNHGDQLLYLFPFSRLPTSLQAGGFVR